MWLNKLKKFKRGSLWLENVNHSIMAQDVINPHPVVLPLSIQTHSNFISNRSSVIGLRYIVDLSLHLFRFNVSTFLFCQDLGFGIDYTVNIRPKDGQLEPLSFPYRWNKNVNRRGLSVKVEKNTNWIGFKIKMFKIAHQDSFKALWATLCALWLSGQPWNPSC